MDIQNSNGMYFDSARVSCQFVTESGETRGAPIDLPINTSLTDITRLCNTICEFDGQTPLSFFVNEKEIRTDLQNVLSEEDRANGESTFQIVIQPQAVFRVRAVTRCTSSLPGHSEPVISVAFSPDGASLASGSGDTTVRFWDLNTETPEFTAKGHKNWVLAISWSPLGNKLASGDKNGSICIWDPITGTQMGRTLTGHKQWITAIQWEPMHLNAENRYLASSSKDGDIRIWDSILGQTLRILTGHTLSVTCLRWGGTGLIYSGSQDRTIKVWRAADGILCRTLEGHGHWVNTMALSTDYVMRTGPFDPAEAELRQTTGVKKDGPTLQAIALQRYETVRDGGDERLVSGSDDFTMMLWYPEKDKKSLVRMTGHQQLINDVKFSPDTRYVASASFDKSIKLWDGKTGKFIATFRGHVQAVYQIAWSADSRLIASGSADSTLKLWSLESKKLEVDLPGHADEVYAVDWSPDGQRVVSDGGNNANHAKTLKTRFSFVLKTFCFRMLFLSFPKMKL